MKKNILFLPLWLCIATSVWAQGELFFGASSSLKLTGGATLTLKDTKLTNNGTVDGAAGTLKMSGVATNANSSIGGTGTTNLQHLTIDKNANDVQLSSGNINVAGNLTMTNGNLDLNGNQISFGATGTIQGEADNKRIYGAGSLTATQTLNAPTTANPANLGFTVTSAQNLGATTVTRTHTPVSTSGNNSVQRHYAVSPTTNTSLNATVQLQYFPSELNGNDVNSTEVWTSADGVTYTSEMNSTRNTTNYTVSLVGVNSLANLTVGVPYPTLTCALVSPPSYYCAGSTINVSYLSRMITYNAGNTFTLQLSDASGSFATPTVLATLSATATSGTISGMLPWAQAAGTGYRVRVVSSNTAFTGANNGANLEVKVSTATATISATSGGIVANPTATGGVNKLIVGCQGTNVVLTANVSGQSSYEWRKNNVFVTGSTNAPTLTVNNNWGDYQLVAIDGNGCGAAADTVGINLQPTPIATVGPNRNICPGTTVKIGGTAQANTTYTWTPATHLSSATAANPDVLATLPATTTYNLQTTKSYTILSANFTCTSVSTPVSVTLKSQPTPPTISLVSPNNLICQGSGSLTLSASNVVGTLRWYRGANLGPSGTNPLTESSTGGVPVAYTARNTDVNGCVSVASNSITLAIRNSPTPTITSSVGALQSGTTTQFNVCTGITIAVFTANISASASTATPIYSWFSPATTPATLTGTGNTNAISGITTTNQRRFVQATYVYPSLTCTANSLTMDIRQNALATGCRVMQNGQEEEVALENTLSVYPNPTSDKLTAQIQVLTAGEANLSLVNGLGQIVWQEQRSLEAGKTDVTLSLAQLPAGIYHLLLDKEDMHQSVKVVKE